MNMAVCLAVQVITERVESQSGTHFRVLNTREASAIQDNGLCNFDILGYKVMVQDWDTRHIYGIDLLEGLSKVSWRVQQWIDKYD